MVCLLDSQERLTRSSVKETMALVGATANQADIAQGFS
jgi:hypothetical protein